MPFSDDELLDFDYSELSIAPIEAREKLAKHGDAYRDQLVIAKWLHRWRDDAQSSNPEHLEGFRNALAAVAGNLRQGELLHDGSIYLDETK